MTIPPEAGASQWIEPGTPAVIDDNPWAFFDSIYCISLRHRADRRESAVAQFAKIGLAGRVTFFLADKHPTYSEQGIYESHQACLRAGLAHGRGPIVVFEDDVEFAHYDPKRLFDAIDFLQTGPAWDAFFFGCYVRRSESTDRPAVRWIRYRSTAHAYVMSRAMAERLVATPWNGVAYDDLLKSLDAGRNYVIYPGFAFQSSSATDNDQRLRLDRYRRLFGGMHFGQRWDEFSHRRWRSMIVMHLLSIMLLAGIGWVIFKLWR